jgi:arylsulfatase A-like enzyme
MLTGKEQLNRRSVFFHYPNYAFHKNNRLGSAVRSGDFKLIQFYDDDSIELYNLKEDLEEENNLAPIRSSKAAALQQSLQTWLNENSARMPMRLMQ